MWDVFNGWAALCLMEVSGLTRLSVLLQQVPMVEVMDYLTLSYLHPTPSSPSPFFVPSPPSLLPAAAVLQGNE